MATRRATTFLVALALVASACGGGSSNAEDASADGLEILVQGEEVLDELDLTTTQPPAAEGAGGAGEGTGDALAFESTGDTLPQDDDEAPAVAGLFEALALFTSCLGDEGYEFIGRPDPEAEATDPVNDGGYGEALGKCAALSQIAQAFQAMQTESDNLDTEGIETRNRQLVHWIDCMEGRGWTIDGVTTDERGLNQPGGMEPPDGESFMESEDLGECAAIAGDAYDAELAAEGNDG